MANDAQTTRDLIAFIDASPSPFHAARTAADRLGDAGFTELDASSSWSSAPARGYVVRGGSLVAWSAPPDRDPATPFLLAGAHTDSPNLRVKPRPDTGRAGYRQLGVEVYGGALLNSWLDRDLGLSGQVSVRTGGGGGTREGERTDLRLVRIDRPLLRIPQLAIHLDRDVNDKGLVLNRQQHLVPVWGLGHPREGELAELVAAEVGAEVLAWDLMLHDLTPGSVLGVDGELVAAPRIDNLARAGPPSRPSPTTGPGTGRPAASPSPACTTTRRSARSPPPAPTRPCSPPCSSASCWPPAATVSTTTVRSRARGAPRSTGPMPRTPTTRSGTSRTTPSGSAGAR
jgi:aspartyl aminopeptidase